MVIEEPPERPTGPSGQTILLVRGAGADAERSEMILSSGGFRVVVAASAEAATDTLRSGGIALVLAEGELPGLSGYDFCRAVRGDPAHRAVPFLVVTDGDHPDATLAVVECGADGLVIEPIPPQVLVSRVVSALHARTRGKLAVADPQPADVLLAAVRELCRVNAQLHRTANENESAHRTLERYAERLESEIEVIDGKYCALVHGARDGILVTDAAGVILEVNERGEKMLGQKRGRLLGKRLFEDVPLGPVRSGSFLLELASSSNGTREIVLNAGTPDESWIELSASYSSSEDEDRPLVLIARDITERHRVIEQLRAKEAALRTAIQERDRMQTELIQAQKLEAVGQLAAGIAHEINTPVQFVSDSIHFVGEAFEDVLGLVTKYRELRRTAAEHAALQKQCDDLVEQEETADLAYLVANVPAAILRSKDGLGRVAEIVRSMKEFAHPDAPEKAETDLNHAIASTLTIARNEYKYVADVETDFGDIPRVCCHAGGFNQAVLNIVVNAAHAVADVVRDTGARGRLTVRTSRDGDDVVVSISDTGGGIPPAIQSRVFDPFFTTKEVGRGTGQGLAIARSTIVDKHGGTLSFETTQGEGTTFFVRLPILPPAEGERSSPRATQPVSVPAAALAVPSAPPVSRPAAAAAEGESVG